MADSQIKSIAIQVSETDSSFNIRFSLDGVVWVPYSTSSSTPITPEDLAISLLDESSSYLLDGINNPTGNMAAASVEGAWYSIRIKGSSGDYGNWSLPVKVVSEPDSAGPLADVARLQRDFSASGLVIDMENEAQVTSYLGELLTDAMDEVRDTQEIDDLYTGTATTFQIRTLQRAEILMARALILERTAEAKALGVQAPLVMEDSDAILAIADRNRERVAGMISSLVLGTDDEPTFSLPAASCSTFTSETDEPVGFRRNILLDENGNPPLLNPAVSGTG